MVLAGCGSAAATTTTLAGAKYFVDNLVTGHTARAQAALARLTPVLQEAEHNCAQGRAGGRVLTVAGAVVTLPDQWTAAQRSEGTGVTEGRPIIDIGPEPARTFYPMATSPNYAMEQNIVRGYSGYSTDVLPTDQDWTWASGN